MSSLGAAQVPAQDPCPSPYLLLKGAGLECNSLPGDEEVDPHRRSPVDRGHEGLLLEDRVREACSAGFCLPHLLCPLVEEESDQKTTAHDWVFCLHSILDFSGRISDPVSSSLLPFYSTTVSKLSKEVGVPMQVGFW